MSNNFDSWKHINSAPKDKEVLVWNGYKRDVAEWSENLQAWHVRGFIISPTHWRGCPSPPVESLPDDPE